MEYKLTSYSKSSGCGCKLEPKQLQELIQHNSLSVDEFLLVGNENADDAAVYNLQNGTAIINTVDFFTPIVDDAFEFGQIAAANAISDVYAMGGKPLFSNAILGWPVSQIPIAVAKQVLAGARHTCAKVNITLAGGHSIEATEPFFGLSVCGIVDTANLKKNSTALLGNKMYITKSIGLGILATALKRNLISDEGKQILISELVKINSLGEHVAKLNYVTAMTDVTGFGLLGHALEMAKGAKLSLNIYGDKVPILPYCTDYANKMIVPDNTYRNWNYISKYVKNILPHQFLTFNDPQTNGGLLIAIDASNAKEFEIFLTEHKLQEYAIPIGDFVPLENESFIIIT